MSKRWLASILLSLVIFQGLEIRAQHPELDVIRISEYYNYSKLDMVLYELSEKYNLKFEFDREVVQKIRFTYYFNKTPLSRALGILVRNTPLKYNVGDDGIIHIIDKTVITETSRNAPYSGPPEKFNFTLSGQVKDLATGESLPFVNLIIKENNSGTTTNIDGYFTLMNVPSDTSSLMLSYIGYKSLVYHLSPKKSIDKLVVELEPQMQQLDEVVVKGKREDLLETNTQVSMIKMTPKNLSKLPNAGEVDVMRAFQLMPGVSASNEASSGLYVRGGTPDQNLVLFDGITVYHVDHLFGFYSAFNSNAIKDIQLFKGGFESKYGDRISCVTDLTGKDGNQKEFNIGGDVGLVSLNAFAEIPLGEKVSTLVAFRRSWKSPLYNAIFDKFNEEIETPSIGRAGRSADFTSQVSSYFYDLNAKVTYRPSDKDILSFSFYNGTDNLDNSRIMETPEKFRQLGLDFNNDIIDLTKWGNTGSSIKWSRKWNDRLYSNSLVSYSNYFSQRVQSREGSITLPSGEVREFNNGTSEDNDLQDFSFKTDLEWKLSNNNQLQFGGKITNYDIKYAYTQNDTLNILNRDDQGNTFAGYIQDEISLFNNKVNLKPGLRYTYYDVTGKSYLEPRFSFSANLTKKIKLKGAWGQYHQFANRVVREDIMSGSRDFWILSDDVSVPVGSATHYIGGLSYETDKFLFDIEGFYKELGGISEYSLRFTRNFREINYEENFFHGTGTAKGLEFLAQKKFGKFNGWIGYTLSEVLYDFPDFSDEAFPASHDVTHEFKIIGLYKWKNWDFGATWIFATGKPYTAPEGGYEIGLLDGESQDFITVGEKNGLRLPDYHRLDLSATYNFSLGADNKVPGSLGLSLFNVYDRKNLWYKEFEVQEGELLETDVHFLGFTPNITLRLSLK